MESELSVKRGARIRLRNGKTGSVVYVVAKQLAAGSNSRSVAKVRDDHGNELYAGAEHIAEVMAAERSGAQSGWRGLRPLA